MISESCLEVRSVFLQTKELRYELFLLVSLSHKDLFYVEFHIFSERIHQHKLKGFLPI